MYAVDRCMDVLIRRPVNKMHVVIFRHKQECQNNEYSAGIILFLDIHPSLGQIKYPKIGYFQFTVKCHNL